MSVGLVARSISRPVRWMLSTRAGFAASVLACFERACNLVTPDGEVVSLVAPKIGEGPLNIVVEGAKGAFERVQPGIPAWVEGKKLRVGPLELTWEGAAVWEPCPDWGALRAAQARILDQLPALRRIARGLVPSESLLAVGWGKGPPEAFILVMREAIPALRAGWQGDREGLVRGASRLAGLGHGLTPAGDDFLLGFMLGAWLLHAEPAALGRLIADAAAPRTTTLSAAWLRAAAEGQCSQSWHKLFQVLEKGEDSKPALQELLAQGASSGGDALAGWFFSLDLPSFAFHNDTGQEMSCPESA